MARDVRVGSSPSAAVGLSLNLLAFSQRVPAQPWRTTVAGSRLSPVNEFDALLCRAGTVRSHLAIIAREFEVPVLMGCVFKREPRNGERLRVRYSAQAQNPDAYHGGDVKPQALIEEVGA